MFILVIDDDEVMRELLTALLEAEGLHVATAASPDAAVGAVREEAQLLDVVLTDLRMPGVDAPAMLRSLREAMSTSTRLIGMSGSDAAPEETALLDAFLLKPFSVEDLLKLAQRAGAPQSSESLGTVQRDIAVLDEAIYARMAKALPKKALRELYELTLDDVAKRTLLLRDAAAAGDSATCKSEAHAMKGGCGMVGAMELRAIASDIETGPPVDTTVLNEIDAAAARLRRMLNALTL